ncbi:TPA: hypothetical protein ACGQU9_005799, partial [Klebsiella michiganensis]
MYHLDNTSGVPEMPEPKEQQSITPRWFGESQEQGGISWPGADWFNTVQAELLNLMSAAGIAPDKKSFNQLSQAIPILGDARIRQDLSSDEVGRAYVDYIHLMNGPVVTMEYFIATNLTPDDMFVTMNKAFAAACASGKTVLLRSDVTYQVSRNDFPVARGTNLIATGGSYATIEVLSPFGDYGLFDMSTENGLDGGRYNIFYGLKFRYPNQVRIIDGTVIVKPVEYPPVFHGGAFESRFINLDMGNAYMAFRLGGAMNGRDLGTASRVVIDNI